MFFTHLLKTNVNFFVIKTFQVGRNRLVPEYTFMDPRGVGAWNMESLSRVEEAVWAMDSMEAGEDGKVRKIVYSKYAAPKDNDYILQRVHLHQHLRVPL